MNLLKCPKCGEMFADSYKECPFCQEDEAYLATDKKAKGPGRRVEKSKSPSILGPALIVVLVLLVAFLVYTFFGDKIVAMFNGTDKPGVVDPIDGPDEPIDPDAHLTIDKTELKLTVGDTAVLTVTGAENCQWSSDKTDVATVDETGKVSAVAEGTAKITASANGDAVNCTVTVAKKAEPKPEPKPESKPTGTNKDLAIATIFGSLNKNASGNWEFTESVGQSFDMEVTGTDSAVTWKSSDTDVATISSDGTFKAVGSGKATITATVDGQTLKCDVIIN